MKKYLIVSLVLLAFGCKNNKSNSQSNSDDTSIDAPANIPYKVVNVYPHDPNSFTEGFFLHDGQVFESIGLNGHSKLLVYDLKSGKVTQSVTLPSEYFGEGISIVNNKLYQLTYQKHKVFVYDLPTLNKIKEMTWPYEGWGMTTDGKDLIISTGSSNLYYVNPEDFSIVKTVPVSNNYGPLPMINELEYVDGIIYSNVWETNNIVKINPKTGNVVGTIDLTNIRQQNSVPVVEANVLNGIAYDSTKNSFLVTGKNWPKTFEIKLN
ncbi:glutaminyl-peptide cyclotransferase [Arachidicoccus sp.]|jgi:glutamine cyclotransferase|uniref:glutaminyl-peptide cyclotransferase n=1 Tax=Arachidicoccus sp. TaxID=1872624 RepID=UPI003D1CFDF0